MSLLRSRRHDQGPASLTLRTLTAGDGDAVDAIFAGMSAQSRYLRFHTPTPRLTAAARRSLLDVDDSARMGLLAQVRQGGRECPVGSARLFCCSPQEAEVALEVVDAWQGRGVGRALLAELGARARDRGYLRLHAFALPENYRVLRLFSRVFPDMAMTGEDGVVRMDCWLRLSPSRG